MLGLAMATALCSIHFCFRRRCTGWRRTCTRCSCRRRGPVLAGQALVVAASEVVADFPAEDSAGVAAAPSERCVGDTTPVPFNLRMDKFHHRSSRLPALWRREFLPAKEADDSAASGL